MLSILECAGYSTCPTASTTQINSQTSGFYLLTQDIWGNDTAFIQYNLTRRLSRKFDTNLKRAFIVLRSPTL